MEATWQCEYMYANVLARCVQCACPSSLRGIPTTSSLWRALDAAALTSSLDRLFQGGRNVGLHDGLRWLCLDVGLLAEHHPHSRLGGWLHLGLDPEQTCHR